MAAEAAISVVIHNSLHVLSEEKILSSGLRDQINAAICDLQNKLITLKLPESGTDNEQQCRDGSGLLDRARGAADIADRFLLEASRRLKSHKPGWIHVRTTKKMARDFITRVKELSTLLSQMQDLSRNAHRGKVRSNGKVESEIVGREAEAHKLLAQLIVQNGDQDALRLRVISVVGEEAIGKTALVRSVYSRLEIDRSFPCRVWVHVPEKFTPKDLLVKILKRTPQKELKDLEQAGEEELKEILHKSLMELRYLIVFDNLRKVEDMDELMILLPDARSGSRVIVTTRVREIPSLIDPWASPLELHKLDANQSNRLLGECGSVAEDPGLKTWIRSKCSCSPPWILLLGGLAAASDDSSPVNVDQHTDNSTLRDIVRLSYHNLPSLLKPCLLYLCLFPKDCEISTRRLFRLWLAEGLVQTLEHTTAQGDEEQVLGSTANELAEGLVQPFEHTIARGDEEQVLGSTAMECFNELVGRNLVHVVRRGKLSGRPKSCRVPSFLHDFLFEMATRLRLLQIHSDNHSDESEVVNGCSSWIVKYQDDNYRQDSQQDAKTEDHQLGGIQLQRVRSYVSFNTQKRGTRSRDVEELLRQLTKKGDTGLLRVLDLEGVYKPLLPDRLGNVLPNLRYLGLRWTVLDSIPESVGNMSRLETLDLKHTNVGNLPSSIWEVKSLQHLYMNEVCFDESTIRMKHQSNLQTLWGLYIGTAKSPMLDVLSKLTRLEKLGLTCNSQVVKKATECISNLLKLRSLKLRSRDLFGQPSDLNLSDMTGLMSVSHLYLLGSLPKRNGLRNGLSLLPRNLKILTLSMSGLEHDPMQVLGGLESLEILNLFADSYSGKKLFFHPNSFPRLCVLRLWKLEKVKEAHVVDETALRRLEELEIKNCGRLTSIASLDHIESLQQISLIKVREKLAENIKGGLTRPVFIKEKQLVSSSSTEATEDSDEPDEIEFDEDIDEEGVGDGDEDEDIDEEGEFNEDGDEE